MTAATRSIPPRCTMNWAGSPRSTLKRGCVARLSGIYRIPNGWIRQAAVLTANGSRRTIPGVQGRRPNEGNHFGGRKRDASLSPDACAEQTDFACLELANLVLPDALP